MQSEQPSLLSYSEQQAARFSGYVSENTSFGLTAAELNAWQQRILQFQKNVPQTDSAAQGTLFALTQTADSEIAADIDPFGLPQENIEFWRQSVEDEGISALYFVIDYRWPILLYVGETVKSNQRWKGMHDCKRYVSHYLTTHNQLALSTQVNISFWRNAPSDRRARQQLERSLIHRWRSPFNKENWDFWGTPFVGKQPPRARVKNNYTNNYT